MQFEECIAITQEIECSPSTILQINDRPGATITCSERLSFCGRCTVQWGQVFATAEERQRRNFCDDRKQDSPGDCLRQQCFGQRSAGSLWCMKVGGKGTICWNEDVVVWPPQRRLNELPLEELISSLLTYVQGSVVPLRFASGIA